MKPYTYHIYFPSEPRLSDERREKKLKALKKNLSSKLPDGTEIEFKPSKLIRIKTRYLEEDLEKILDQEVKQLDMLWEHFIKIS